MLKSELIQRLNLTVSSFNKLVQSIELPVKDEYTSDESQQILSSGSASIKKASNTAGSGSIVDSSKKRSQVSKREAMAQAVQDAQEASRIYAQTYLTALNVGTEEFTDSLTQHLGDMRQNLLEVEDDDDFLAQLMSGGCGGSLPS